MIPLSCYPIGLTGGMGSGKTTVSAILASRGFTVIDADRITRLAYLVPEVKAQLIAEFGGDIYDNGAPPQIIRPLLAQRAFGSNEKRQRLNAIMHPAMRAIAGRELDQAKSLAILDAPLLFEAGWDALVRTTAAVLCPEDTRIARIVARDGLTREQIEKRLRAQFDDYQNRANFLLYNTGSLRRLILQVDRVFGESGTI